MRRLGVAGFAAMNIMLLSVSVWSGAGGDMDRSVQTLFHWLSALIALPAVAYAGQPFFGSAASALKARRLNMDVPISLGVILATAMSLFQTMRGSEQVYFDAAVTLLAFLLIGRLLDQQMRRRAAGAATNLLGLRLTSASVVDPDGNVRRVPVRSLLPGMCVAVAAGERIAADGVIVHGESSIDDSLITGESAPRAARPGDTVYAGTVNLAQPLRIEVTAREDGSLLAEIARLMAQAEQGRGRYVRLADRAARFYAPAVHVLGLSTFIGWLLAGHGWETGAHGGHRRSDHHMPVRAGPGRSGGASRRGEPAVQSRSDLEERGWPRTDGGNRHGCSRQDWNVDARRAAAAQRARTLLG